MEETKYYIVGDKYKSISKVFNENDNIIAVPYIGFVETINYLDNLKINEFDIIIINSEALFSNEDYYIDYKGILLLKWLRVFSKILNRILITGFVSREDLIKDNPKEFILFAPSTYFLQLPFSKDQFNNFKLNSSRIKSEDALVKNYKPFIKPDFDIQQFGHSFANKYGLYLMEKMHKNFIDKEYLNTEIESHEHLFEFIKADFIYGVENKKEQLNKIKSKQKKILYIDDLAENGWGKLLESILGQNVLTTIVPDINQDNYIDKIVNIITNKKPDTVLLDLRLGGDIEARLPINEVSGFKVLKIIKNKFPVLPVIMFSATNKAENLSALLKLGAFGLWTKPRVEHNLNKNLKYNELIDVLENSFNIYKNPIDEWMLETDFFLEKLYSSRQQLIKKIKKTFVYENANKIPRDLKPLLYSNFLILDTNAFRETESSDSFKKYQLMFLFLTILSRALNKKLVIIDDVLQELFIGSKRNIPYPQKTVCSYSLNKIFEAKKKYGNIISNEYKIIDAYFKNTKFIFDHEDNEYKVYSETKKLVSVFDTEEDALKLIGSTLILMGKDLNLH